jgi:hypothetical protein
LTLKKSTIPNLVLFSVGQGFRGPVFLADGALHWALCKRASVEARKLFLFR